MSSLPSTAVAEPMRSVHSELLGEIRVREEDVLTFEQGLLGFPMCREFLLVPVTREGTWWLQSAEYPSLAFLVVDPFMFYPEYALELNTGELELLSAADPSDVLVLGIVTLPQLAEEGCTVNLQGPVAVNLRERTGMQVAMADAKFGVRCPIDLSLASAT